MDWDWNWVVCWDYTVARLMGNVRCVMYNTGVGILGLSLVVLRIQFNKILLLIPPGIQTF